MASRWPTVKRLRFEHSVAWIDTLLQRFAPNLLCVQLDTGQGAELNVVSIYSPAWAIPEEELGGVDISPVALTQQPSRLWVADLLWTALRERASWGDSWILAGDLNSSVTFDEMWPGGPHGNRELLVRFEGLGLVECLAHTQGQLTPTFRNPKNGAVIHQMDHLFASPALSHSLSACQVGSAERVFEDSLSDHLPIVADFDWPF